METTVDQEESCKKRKADAPPARAPSPKLAKPSEAVPQSPPDAAESDSSCLPPISFKGTIVVRRYCLIFGEQVTDEFFEGGLESEACRRVAAIVASASAAAQQAGYELVLHRYTEGCLPYHLNADDGELWCNLPESALEALMQELGDKIEAIVEEISY